MVNNPDAWKDIKIGKDSATKSEVKKTRPEKPPHARKKFEEVAGGKKEEKETLVEQEDEPKKKLSVFDLSASEKHARQEAGAIQPSVDIKNESTAFMTEQPDLPTVNLLAGGGNDGQMVKISSTSTGGFSTNESIQAIAQKMIDRVYLIKKEGQTDTIIMLNNVRGFEGSSIVISAFDSAKGEFNIAFYNLTQSAKEILDSKIHKQSLLTALQDKGYTVQIFTATTTELPAIQAAEESSNLYRPRDEEKQGEQQKQEQEGEPG